MWHSPGSGRSGTGFSVCGGGKVRVRRESCPSMPDTVPASASLGPALHMAPAPDHLEQMSYAVARHPILTLHPPRRNRGRWNYPTCLWIWEEHAGLDWEGLQLIEEKVLLTALGLSANHNAGKKAHSFCSPSQSCSLKAIAGSSTWLWQQWHNSDSQPVCH